MTLADVVNNLETFPDEQTIYATKSDGKWVPESYAFVMEEPEDAVSTQSLDDSKAEYFLEVYLAKEAVAVWQEWRKGRKPNGRDKFRAVTYYAEHDAYISDESALIQ